MEQQTTQAIPPTSILLYLLGMNDSVLKHDCKLVVYQKDLNLAINALDDDEKVLSNAMRVLTTLLTVVVIFPSERYIPTIEEIAKLREEIK